jgi:alpha-ketoglutarate-dependent taurine dioxygenase
VIVDGEIEGPRAWTRDSLAEGAGYLRLSAECWDEIEAIADHLRQHPLPTLALAPDDFALTACRALMADARRLLDAGPGFVVLDRLPLEGLSRDEAVQAYWLLGSLLARPVAQKWDGTMVYDVRDYGRPPGNGVRPDRTNVEQSFHTDNSYNLCPPEYVGLLCLQTAMEGGVSQVVSLATTHNALRRERPDVLPRLYRPFCFDRQREHEPGDALVERHPIFERDGDRLTWRLSRFQVVNGQQLAGEPLDAEGAAALDALDAVMARPALHAEFRFQPGQIQLVANRVVAHKRTAFLDWPEPERARHLVRLWLRDRGRRSYHG